MFPDTTLSRGGVPDIVLDQQGHGRRACARRRRRVGGARSSRAARGSARVRAPFAPVWNRELFAAVSGRPAIPVLAVGGIRTAAEVRRHPRRRRGRPRRHRPALLRRARPRRAHPRRRARPGPVPQLEPLRRRADARHEGRLLQPRSTEAVRTVTLYPPLDGTIGQVGDLLLRNVRPWPREPGGSPVDVVIRDGRIATGEAPAGVPVAEGRGGVLLPAFADAHAHLDSTRLGLPFRPHTAGPGLAGLIDNDRRTGAPPEARSASGRRGRWVPRSPPAPRRSAATSRSTPTAGSSGWRACWRPGRRTRGRADVQVVAFPQSGIVRDPGTADLLDAAVRAGADLVGGLDPCAYDRDPVAHLDVVFGIAERHGVGVDIHLHEVGDLGAFTFELIAERTAALGMQGQVTISHAFALGTVDAEPAGGADRAARDARHRARRPLRRATASRCRCWRFGMPASASGSAKTGFATTGRRTATATCWSVPGSSRFATGSAATTSSSCASTWRRAADGPSSARRPGRERRSPTTISPALAPGARADLVVVAADTVCAAVMDHPPRTLVIRGGEVIARDGELC